MAEVDRASLEDEGIDLDLGERTIASSRENERLNPYNPSRAIAALYRSNHTFLRARLQERGIDMSHADFLLALSLDEGMTQQDLSRELFVSKAAVARTTKNLCEKGIVRRVADERDKRVHRLYFTEKGAALVPVIKEIFDELIGQYTSVFEEDERAEFKRLSLKALAHMRRTIEDQALSDKE